jgi:hypothetical protein
LRETEATLKAGNAFPHAQIVTDSLVAATRQLANARNQIDGLIKRPRAERKDEEVTAAVKAMIDAIGLLAPGLNVLENTLAQSDPALINYVMIARLATEMRDFAGQQGSVLTVRPLKSELSAES